MKRKPLILENFEEIGCALEAIRDKRVYKLLGFPRWKSYCRDQLRKSVCYADVIIDASKISLHLRSKLGIVIRNWGIAHELRRIKKPKDEKGERLDFLRIEQLATAPDFEELTMLQVRERVSSLIAPPPKVPMPDDSSNASVDPDQPLSSSISSEELNGEWLA